MRTPTRPPAAPNATSKAAMRAFLDPRRRVQRAADAWDGAVGAALEQAGLDLGEDEGLAAGLGRYVSCLAGMPDLTASGWLQLFGGAVARFQNRLRVRAVLEERPEVLLEEIRDPVFVVGLPRSATTVVHRFLAGRPGHRGPLLWEYSHTALELPEPERAAAVGAVDEYLDALLRAAPGFSDIHHVGGEEPEECDWLLPHSNLSLTLAATDDYRGWLEARDVRPDYRYLRQALQVLQHGRAPRRWILKSPGHVSHLAAIAEVFPGARFVWTHRDPVEVVASYCSLVESLSRAHRGALSPQEVGRFWCARLAASAHAGSAQRAALPGAVVDVAYRSLVADPRGEMERVTEHVGGRWTPADDEAVRRVFGGRAGAGTHRYSLDRYGLTAHEVEDAFAGYLADMRPWLSR
ncbi:sulfotransferase [Cellulomonas sp. JZ18]|uniref:sulfotransferase family protein n=1 Tax=Cellulomonas sp. JZ18 TaxID=2654191 RepID=UPI0012D44D56|nr:sulfotransferase [Cellulomonas sp. JZ18]QGQ18364.1 sulfotransferase [Cellulomonas sp. JZ18]